MKILSAGQPNLGDRQKLTCSDYAAALARHFHLDPVVYAPAHGTFYFSQLASNGAFDDTEHIERLLNDYLSCCGLHH